MDGFSVNTRLTAADWKALSVASSRRTQGRGWRGAAVVVGLPALIWALWVGLMHFVHSPVEANSLGIGVVVGYGAVYLLFRVVRSWHKPAAEGNFLGEWHYDFSPLGIRYGTAQRTLLLVNDQRDLESHPLASVTGATGAY